MAHAADDDGSGREPGQRTTVPSTTPPDFGRPPQPSAEPSSNPLLDLVAQAEPAGEQSGPAAEFVTTYQPFQSRAFATGFATSGAGIGPMAIAETPDGDLLVSGGTAQNQIYRFGPHGGPATTPSAQLPYPIYNLAFDLAGNLWATTGGGPLLKIDPATGQVLDRFGDGFGGYQAGLTIALAVHSQTGLIYVSSDQGIERFNPTTQTVDGVLPGTFEHFSRDEGLRVGSLAFDNQSNLWAATWPDRSQVVRFNGLGRAEPMLALESPIDSIAFGLAGTPLAGLMFVSHVGGSLRDPHQTGPHPENSQLTLVDVSASDPNPSALPNLPPCASGPWRHPRRRADRHHQRPRSDQPVPPGRSLASRPAAVGRQHQPPSSH